MKKETKTTKLEKIEKTTGLISKISEYIFYTSLYASMSIILLAFPIIAIYGIFTKQQESYMRSIENIEMLVSKLKFIVILIMISIFVFSIGKIILNEIREERKSK